MQKTKIEYLDYTWNVTHGCTPVSEGCANCWAKTMSKRLAAMGVRGYDPEDPFKPTICPWKLDEPLKLRKPAIIGVSFMGDLFHEDIEYEILNNIFQTIYLNPEHTYLILTKRPQNMLKFLQNHVYMGAYWFDIDPKYHSQIWLGVTCENQKAADERIPILLQIPVAVRFVSLEPLLGEIDLKDLTDNIDWCIIGGESAGRASREMKEVWVRKVVEQCKKANVSVFYKQKIVNGKKISMPFLDGKQYAEFPRTIGKQNDLQSKLFNQGNLKLMNKDEYGV